MPEIAGIGILSAFLAGIVSFLSPCVLPLVPGYLSYVSGRSVDDLAGGGFSRMRLATLGLSLSFSLGFSAVFIALGASATALGQLFQSYRSEADLIAGTIVGEPAMMRAQDYPEYTVFGFDRLLGRPFFSPIVDSVKALYSYPVVLGDDGEVAVKIGEFSISLEEIMALLVKEVGHGLTSSSIGKCAICTLFPA